MRLGIAWQRSTTLHTHQEKAFSILWHTKVDRVQNLGINTDVVTRLGELPYHFLKKTPMVAKCQALDVLEYEGAGVQFSHQPQKIVNQGVAGIINRPLPDQGKPLAPPHTTSNARAPMPAASRMASPVNVVTLWGSTARSGKLNLWTAAWIGSISTAATTSKPACSKPGDMPPAPENRSIAIGRLPKPAPCFFPTRALRIQLAYDSRALGTKVNNALLDTFLQGVTAAWAGSFNVPKYFQKNTLNQ